MLVDLIGWIIIGLLAGGVASLLVPGRTPGGCLGATLIGMLGGLLGGWLFRLIFGPGATATSFLGSLIVSTIGAVIILFLIRAARGRRSAI